MHLADGIVTQPALLAALDVAGGAAVALAITRAFRDGARHVAWTGTLAAFVLAAQAVNVPLVPGASAHAIGTALLVLCLGAPRAIVAVTAVLIVQALTLGDGGLTTLGLNVLDMAVLPALVTAGMVRAFGRTPRGLVASGLLGAWVGTALGAACLASVLVIGAGAPARVTFVWLLGVQSIAGAIEGVLTALAIRSLLGRAPALFRLGTRPEGIPAALDNVSEQPEVARGVRWAAVALVLVTLLVPFASSTPDALQVVLRHLHVAP